MEGQYRQWLRPPCAGGRLFRQAPPGNCGQLALPGLLLHNARLAVSGFVRIGGREHVIRSALVSVTL